MKTINFKQFSVFTDISKKHTVTGDVREDFANILYMKFGGIKSHNLAFRIYNSNGEEKYSEEEIELMVKASEAFCLPNFIDALQEQINQNNKTQEQ